MPLLLEVHDAARFDREILPALTLSWRERTFEPVRPLCQALLPAVRETSGSDWEGQVVARVVAGLSFAPVFWRGLVDEVLLFAAVEVPPVPDAREALCRGYDDSRDSGDAKPQASDSPIEQAYRGSRDLRIGAVCFRPLAVGLNCADDVARLAQLLAAIDPDSWNADLVEADDLAYARQALADLRELYARTAEQRRLIVCENW